MEEARYLEVAKKVGGTLKRDRSNTTAFMPLWMIFHMSMHLEPNGDLQQSMSTRLASILRSQQQCSCHALELHSLHLPQPATLQSYTAKL